MGLVAITMMAPAAFAAPAPAGEPMAQAPAGKRTITGTVVDAADGEPLPGATVAVVGDKSSVTATDIDGNFSLNVPSGKKCTLIVTYVGYKESRVPVEDLGYIKVAMKGDDNTLDEVIVVGAGTQKRVSVTGAITSVKGDALKLPSTNLTNALAGNIAGVVATASSGEPGAASSFYIRGIGTFGGRQTPLILLDDVEISANDLNYVPAENIESFSILKDASATAIYGARGANGVMIVKTKGGDYNSQTKIGVSFDASFNFIKNFPEFVDGARYMELYNIANQSRDRAAVYSPEEIGYTRMGTNPYIYPNVDWSSVLFKNMATRQRGNVNVSGGGSKVKYYMSIDAQHEDGVLKPDKIYSWNNNIQLYNYTFQNNISYKVTPTTTISMNMNAQIRQKTGPNVGANALFNYTLTTTPIVFPVTFPANNKEEYVTYASRKFSEHNLVNPWAALNTSYSQWNETTLNTVVKLNQELDFITKGLRFEAWVNLKSWSSMSFTRSITPYYLALQGQRAGYITDNGLTTDPKAVRTTVLQEGTQYLNESELNRGSDQTFEVQSRLDWNRKFGMHDVGAMVSYRQWEYRGDVLPNRNQGFSFRATYDYAHRYLAEFNAGYNGTERLKAGERFGFFPAGSIGWVVSNEEWFEPLSSVVNNFKLRASLGIVGSDDLNGPGSHFLYIDKIDGNNIGAVTWTSGDYNVSTTTKGGPKVIYYATPGIVWEKSRKLDVGAELTLFRDLTISGDLFWENRYDIFIKREAWPASLGYDSAIPYANTGTMENKGGEISVNYNKRLNNDWSFSLRGNFTYSENKVTNWDEAVKPYSWLMGTNLPASSSKTMGYIAEGLFQSDEEIANSPKQNLGSNPQVGDIKYRDLNGDGQITSDDQTMISEYGRLPRIQYGFGGTLNFKKFDFGFQFTGSAMRTITMGDVHPFNEGNPAADARNVLTWISDSFYDPINNPNNFDVEYPRLGNFNTDVSNNNVNSTWWMRDGSFMRLRNLELGWSFPYGRVYLSGQNLVTFSPFKHWDPELGGWNSYPMSRTVSMGVQITI